MINQLSYVLCCSVVGKKSFVASFVRFVHVSLREVIWFLSTAYNLGGLLVSFRRRVRPIFDARPSIFVDDLRPENVVSSIRLRVRSEPTDRKLSIFTTGPRR